VLISNKLVPVFRIDFVDRNPLYLVASVFVIQNDIGNYLYTCFLQLFDCREVLFFGAVFRPRGAFLIKLAKVEQIINRIPGFMSSAPGLVRWWQPGMRYAER
jgi:hypothetical protein